MSVLCFIFGHKYTLLVRRTEDERVYEMQPYCIRCDHINKNHDLFLTHQAEELRRKAKEPQ